MAKSGLSCSSIKKTLPVYSISKNKIQLSEKINVDKLLQSIREHFKTEKVTTIDGVKIDFADKWVHLRKSNTEPIIRIYAEAKSMEEADGLIEEINVVIRSIAE